MRLCKPKTRLVLCSLVWCCHEGLAQISPSTDAAVREVLDKAMLAATTASDGNVQRETFPILAELWVVLDRTEAALRIRQLVDASGGFVDGLKRATVMVKLARFQGLAGDRTHALATLDRAQRDADGALFVVTSAFWISYWSEMPGPEVFVSRTAARDALVEEARQIRDEIDGRTAQRSQAAQAVARHKGESLLPVDSQTVDALREIARIGTKGGSWNDVLRTVTLVKSPLMRVDLMCQAAEAAAKVGDTTFGASAYGAAHNACARMNIFNPKERSSAFARLAASLAQTGNVSQARKLTPNLGDPRVRGRIKRLIAYTETTRGGGAGTLKWVESELVPDARVYGLIGIAEAMLGKDSPPDSVEYR